jgi:hypothetical protein
LKVGQEVDVHLNIRGRSWQNPQGETKYFNTLEAWKIDVLGATAQPHIADDLDEMFKR